MYNKIKSIFKNKIIENVIDTSNNSYYYFYEDHTCKNIFGIKKDITSSEYLMLNTMFIEKKTYSLDSAQQKLGEYLFGSGDYPFKKDVKFIIYSVSTDDEEIISKVLSDVYKDVVTIKYLKHTISFGQYDENVKDMFNAFTTDFGYIIPLHFGFNVSKNTKGKDIAEYINYYDKNLSLVEYSNITNMVVCANNKDINIINIIKEACISKIKEQHVLLEIITTFLKNNLNVSLTSKLLYMHRNSVLNKLEQIKKITGLDIQNFIDAYTIKVLLDLE